MENIESSNITIDNNNKTGNKISMKIEILINLMSFIFHTTIHITLSTAISNKNERLLFSTKKPKPNKTSRRHEQRNINKKVRFSLINGKNKNNKAGAKPIALINKTDNTLQIRAKMMVCFKKSSLSTRTTKNGRQQQNTLNGLNINVVNPTSVGFKMHRPI